MSIKACEITFDGLDKSGKDTVRDIITKKYCNILINMRTYFSQIVYARIYKRKRFNEKFFFDSLISSTYAKQKFFIFSAGTKVITKRCIEHNEKDISIGDIDLHRHEFFKLIKEVCPYVAPKSIFIIDTTSDTPKQTAKKILEILEKNQ